MEKLFLNPLTNENGQPNAWAWALCVIAAVIVFATIMFLIYRLYGRYRKRQQEQQAANAQPVTEVPQVEPDQFEKRVDDAALQYYDQDKAKEEEARIQALLVEEEKQRKELEAKERELELKKQREEEERLERERIAAEREAEKERQRAEKERAKAEKEAAKQARKNRNKEPNFFADYDDEEADAFNANDDEPVVNFWADAQADKKQPAEPAVVTDPRLEQVLAELENQKQAEQDKFASLMAELENQKQETARLKDELDAKQKSEDAIAQAKKEMEQMIKDSQAKMDNIADQKNIKSTDQDLLEEIKNIMAGEREAQEKRLREQENSLAAVLSAMEDERRAKEENQRNAQQEAQKEDEFLKLQNQYQDAIAQMQDKFQQMLNDANAQKAGNTAEVENAYQAQLERERAETATLIEQMQREVDKMNAEREAERREYEAKQKELNAAMEAALRTQRAEFDQAQQQTNNENLEKILQDMENQRAQEQEMFANILNEIAAGREDTNQAQAAMEQMVRESEARIDKLEQQTARGLDEESLAALKDVLAAERADQEKLLTQYQDEIAALRETIIANQSDNPNGEGNQVVYTARDPEADAEMMAQIEAMQSEIRKMSADKEAEKDAYEQRHAELLDALNRTIVTGENAQNPETQLAERESVDRILQDIEAQKQMEQERFTNIMNELAVSREDTKKAQEAMQQLIQESSDLINQLSNKNEVRGVDDETLAALKDVLAAEREAQEKRLAENEENLRMVVAAIEEQQQYLTDEQNKQAEYEKTIADLRAKYEAEMEELRNNLSEKTAEVDNLHQELAKDADVAVAENQQDNATVDTVANGDGDNDDDDAANQVEYNEEDEVINEEVLAQLAKMQEEIEKLEKARADERAEFERKYDELNKVLDDSLKVQRLEMELAKEKEVNELKMQQALEAQRAEIEASKEKELAEQRRALEAEKSNTNEQTNTILAEFKDEINRQYEDFLTLLNNKKAEEANAKNEYDALMEQAGDENKQDIQEMLEQLREERKAARAEAQALREELEAQRIESEARLMKQLSEVKEGLVSELSSELEIKEKFDSLEQEVENHNQEKLKQNEAEEARIKQEYEEYKQKIADEVMALEEKNAALQAELEKTRQEQAQGDEAKQAEYEENEKRLREKYMQLRSELMKEAQQVSKQSEEIEAEKRAIEDKKRDLEEEKTRLQNEVEMLKQQVLEIKTQDNGQGEGVTEEQLAVVREQLEVEYKNREKEMLDKLEQEKQALVAREAQLKLKESNIEREEERIKEQSMAVTTMITNREYTKEERERLVLDYTLKLQDLEERLRQNEKALRENNREFIPLRRIKNTLDRDMRLLRKREAIVAKQEVLVYGVNNISTVDPDKIKKLEQDIKQLTGLQQSVANCETILNKNKDRYPTLENLDRVLRAQNEQIRNDLEEVKAAMAMFGENGNNGENGEQK